MILKKDYFFQFKTVILIALVVFRVLRKETKRRTKLIHVILHTITLLFIMISLKAVWDSHRYHRDSFGKLDPLPNLYSLHSWIGIALVTIYFGQVSSLISAYVTFKTYNL